LDAQFPLLKQLFSFLFFLVLAFVSRAQDSCNVTISLLTCAPGQELYSLFGHTALRVQDSNGNDDVYNYGTFEFGPDFYPKFIRGKLLYALSVENFPDFLSLYQYERRSVQEQVLLLSCAQKDSLLQALRANALPQNRNYRYDFLFDNCTTRARDVTQKAAPLQFRNILPADRPSFRNLIHEYLDAGHQPWSKLGIDLLLGVKLDRRVTNTEAMFLPDYLLKGFDSARLDGRPLVSAPQTILKVAAPPPGRPVFTPLVCFGLLFLLVLFLQLRGNKKVQKGLQVFDFLFFFSIGLTGAVLLFMWFGTDHYVCRYNYNLLWALPTHLVAAFFVGSQRRWVSAYFRYVSMLMIVLVLAWFFLPQQMNPGFLPLLALAGLRSWQLSKKDHGTKATIR